MMTLYLHPSKQTLCSVYCYTTCRLWFQHCVDFLFWVLCSQDAPLIYCIKEQFYCVINQAAVFVLHTSVIRIKCIPSKYQYLLIRQHDVKAKDHYESVRKTSNAKCHYIKWHTKLCYEGMFNLCECGGHVLTYIINQYTLKAVFRGSYSNEMLPFSLLFYDWQLYHAYTCDKMPNNWTLKHGWAGTLSDTHGDGCVSCTWGEYFGHDSLQFNISSVNL